MTKTRIRYIPTISKATPREICYACFRPVEHCLCNQARPFEAHCKILLLQHPNERKKYYSTAKLVLSSIKNSNVFRSVDFDLNEVFRGHDLNKTYLLYPTVNSIDCKEVLLDQNSTVLVIDGTWREARKILYHNPRLKTLPTISFATPLTSKYRIRKQPKENCLSTLESVGHLLKANATALGKLEMLPLYDQLFSIFDQMVAKQISYFPRNQLKVGQPSASPGTDLA